MNIMKLLVFICILIAAEAAKLSKYALPHTVPTTVPLPATTPGSSGHYYAGHNQQIPSGQSSQNGGGQSFSNGHLPGNPIPGNVSPSEHSGPYFTGHNQQIPLGQSSQNGGGQFSSNGQISGNDIPGSVSPAGNSGPYYSGQNQQIASGQSSQNGAAQSSSNGHNFGNNTPLGIPPAGPANGHSSESGTNGQDGDCPEGQVPNVDGTCVDPEITRHLYLYSAPEQGPRPTVPPTDIPLPKIEHNILFIRTHNGENDVDPIIIPPPQTKHIIYVLNKESENQGPKVIEVPTPEHKSPEVYFVNYADGENLTLPDGTDFETALNSAIQGEGQVISDNNGGIPTNGGNGHDNNSETASENGSGTIGYNGSYFSYTAESESTESNSFSSNGEIHTFGLNSQGPQNFIGNGQFSNGATNGIGSTSPVIRPPPTATQAPTTNGVYIPIYNNGFNGNAASTNQVNTNNGVSTSSGLGSGASGLPTSTHQTSTNNGAFLPQGYNNGNGIVTPTQSTTSIPQRLYHAP